MMTEVLSINDLEWSNDWKIITDLYESLENIKKSFKSIDVSYLREVQQNILILQFEKYLWSLQNYIIEKYG